MVKERINDLVDILAEKYAQMENTFLIRNNEQLMKYLENPETWQKKQNANKFVYKKQLIRDARQQLNTLNQQSAKVLLLSYKEVDKDVIEISEKQITINKYQDEIKKKISMFEKANAKAVSQLANTAFKEYNKTVKIIGGTKSADTIYEAVKKQMPKGIQNGLKINYSNGRQMTWKSYMEMKSRTDINHEITEKQMEIGAVNNQVFMICDSFADCAKDHADYQGKIYYNAKCNLTKEMEAYIRSNNILSMQEVSEGEPFLTTRPNCRHNFHSISTDDVLGGKSSDQILKDEKLIEGKYDESNYKDLEQQRYNERQIRKWKTELENQKQVAKMTGIPNKQAEQKAQEKISEWQKKQRDLIKSNPDVLQRRYDRENAKIIVDDLGVKYDYKVVDGELVKKK